MPAPPTALAATSRGPDQVLEQCRGGAANAGALHREIMHELSYFFFTFLSAGK